MGNIMRKPSFGTSAILVFLFFCFAVSYLLAQEPAPYSQLDPKPYNPAEDANPDMFMRSWEESPARHLFGSLIVRDIFAVNTGNPVKPEMRGAVLTRLLEFFHATLNARTATIPSILTGKQAVFYIAGGRADVTAGDRTQEVREGCGILMPEGLEFIFKNVGDAPLEMYVYVEPVPDGFVPRKDMLVRDENTIPFAPQPVHWSNLDKKLFDREDGLAILLGVRPVWLAPMTMAQPHAADAYGADILWVALEGEIYSLLGKQLRRLPPGTAYKNPGDGRFVHSNINVTDKPIKLLWARTVASR